MTEARPVPATRSRIRVPRDQRWTALLLGCSAGALFCCSIPKPDYGLLAWIFLLPCLLAASWLRPAPALASAFIGGLVAATGRTYWIAPTLHLYGKVPWVAAVLTTVLLITYLAAYWPAFLWMYRRLPRGSLAAPWLAASAWVLLEWVQSWLLSGFPWELVGYTQHANLPLLQLASLTGVYGLSFLVVLVNATIAEILTGRLTLRLTYGVVLPPLLLLGGVYVWGYQRLEKLETRDGAELLIGVVQGNVSQDHKWKSDYREAATAHYAGLAHSLPADSLDLIVMPETALPFYLDHPLNSMHRARIAQLARQLRTPLLVGSLGGAKEQGVYNRAYLFDRGGEIADFSDKVHLVPFGEYLPFPWLFEYLEGLTKESGAFAHGKGHKAMTVPGTRIRFGVFICFESIFPYITRELVQLGSSFLITTTNDAWFGLTAAPRQHFVMAVLRAVETGRPVVRVANTGISGAIAPSGKVKQTTGLFETTTLVAAVLPRTEMTLYARHGDMLILVAATLLGIAWIRGEYLGARQVKREQEQARADLHQYARSPRPLVRPVVLLHGYQNDPDCWRPLMEQLVRCCTDVNGMVYAPHLEADEGNGVRELAASLLGSVPRGAADLVGHSMGGLVAVEFDAIQDHTEGRILTLAAPLRGTWMARLGRWFRFPCPTQLRDMTPGSRLTARVQALLDARRGRLYAWHINGDPVVSRNSALVPPAINRSYRPSWRTSPANRHRHMCADIRVIRDIIAVLQNRNTSPAHGAAGAG